LTHLERDRRLNRIDDLFTVGLLSSFITWKLGGSDDSDSGLYAPSPHYTPENLTTSAELTMV